MRCPRWGSLSDLSLGEDRKPLNTATGIAASPPHGLSEHEASSWHTSSLFPDARHWGLSAVLGFHQECGTFLHFSLAAGGPCVSPGGLHAGNSGGSGSNTSPRTGMHLACPGTHSRTGLAVGTGLLLHALQVRAEACWQGTPWGSWWTEARLLVVGCGSQPRCWSPSCPLAAPRLVESGCVSCCAVAGCR